MAPCISWKVNDMNIDGIEGERLGGHKVCPVEQAGGLDSPVRRLLQNPFKILSPYVREGMRVLDFGCGTGYFTLPMAQMVGATGKVVGADLQSGMLDRLAEKAQGPLRDRIVLHNCASSSAQLSEPFDFILACYVVHELPDVRAWFDDMRALLNPHGTLLLLEPPFHVSRREFNATLNAAQRAGFTCVARPKVFFAMSALLR